MATPAQRLAALEHEREGYVRRDLPKRVKEVDAVIRQLKKEMSAKAGPETPEKDDQAETPEG